MRRGQLIAVAALVVATAIVLVPLLTLADDERLPEQRPTVVRTDDMTWRSTPSSSVER
ncbi:hypothetical protein SAMN05216553_101382 [Lentzea fradiae]|uniref:Uncharacterized protein n=1 Tax=Lentzea fradiae TaxID=200378 RepID=A0A1G7KNW2_9PSEU|nr:hypothetical protein [Lentzea fradiae]SDF38640.1 hypothetical protein SAMN05216553_101382 [Lentzea fradiae]